MAIYFGDSNRWYTLDNKGKLEGPIETINDEYAGHLDKNGLYDGITESTAYVINCIEDLVEFSKNYETYQSSYVKLARDLDFNSIFSYNDYTTKEYGDLNGDETTDELRTELTKQGDKCGGFTPIGVFKGTFDGQGNRICNLYENRGTSSAGLFDTVTRATIKNLGLQNITLTGGTYIGGVVASAETYSTIINCYIEGKSEIKCALESGNIFCGLVVGCAWGTTSIEQCFSIGTISLDTTGTFGGVVGKNESLGITKKCYSIMDILSTGSTIGGIVGQNQGSIVEECYHIGNIIGGDNSRSAGIVGHRNKFWDNKKLL